MNGAMPRFKTTYAWRWMLLESCLHDSDKIGISSPTDSERVFFVSLCYAVDTICVIVHTFIKVFDILQPVKFLF